MIAPHRSIEEEDVVNVARGGGIALIGKASTRALGYLYNLALIWALNVEQFGLFILATTIVSFFSLLSNLGLPLGVIRFGAMHKSEEGNPEIHQVMKTAMFVVFPTSIAMTLITYFGAESLSNLLFHKPELAEIIRSMAWGMPFIAYQSIFLAATRALKVMKYTTIVSIIQPLLALVLSIILIVLGFGLSGAVFAFNFSFVLGSALSIMYYLKLVPGRVYEGPWFSIRKLLRFSIPLSVTEWMHYTNERIEVFFLGLLPGAAAISIYKIAWSLAGLETLIRLSLEEMLAPVSSDLAHRKEIGKLGALYKATAKWGFTFSLMLFFVYLLFGREILSLFNIQDNIGVFVLVVLSAAQLFNELTGACNTILIMSGRSDLTMMNTILLLGINIGLNWWLILDYGLIGAAIAGAAAVVMINMLRVLEVWWTLKIQPLKSSFINPLLIGAITAFIVYFVHRNLSQDKIIFTIMFAFAYCLLFLFGVLNINLDPEDRYVLNAIKQKLQKIRVFSNNPHT